AQRASSQTVQAAAPALSSLHQPLAPQKFSPCTDPIPDDLCPSPPRDLPSATTPTHRNSNSASSAPAFRPSLHLKSKAAHAYRPYPPLSRRPCLSPSSLLLPSSHPVPGTQSPSQPATTHPPTPAAAF